MHTSALTSGFVGLMAQYSPAFGMLFQGQAAHLVTS
jgi:hypothetical protein